jgi:hypothetical protein
MTGRSTSPRTVDVAWPELGGEAVALLVEHEQVVPSDPPKSPGSRIVRGG